MIPKQTQDEGPPIFKTWLRVYAATLTYAVLVMAALYLFTVHFTY